MVATPCSGHANFLPFKNGVFPPGGQNGRGNSPDCAGITEVQRTSWVRAYEFQSDQRRGGPNLAEVPGRTRQSVRGMKGSTYGRARPCHAPILFTRCSISRGMSSSDSAAVGRSPVSTHHDATSEYFNRANL